MQKLKSGMLLYHGSYCKVQNPDLRQCAKHKDFGQGFYLTTSREQAENFARISLRRAVANGIAGEDRQYGVVSVFRCRNIEKRLVRMYSMANAEWLHCVVGHRKSKTFPDVVQELEKFDIVGGKIADDNTNATITTYMAGGFGMVGSESADKICISLLLPEKLQDQFCFRTDEALQCLIFVESVQIWL